MKYFFYQPAFSQFVGLGYFASGYAICARDWWVVSFLVILIGALIIRRKISRGKICRLYKDGSIDRSIAEDQLRSWGYNNDEIFTFLEPDRGPD